MARLIFISPYMKGGRDAARLAHRTRYFATREGVQLLKDDNAHLPVTKKQQQYKLVAIANVLKVGTDELLQDNLDAATLLHATELSERLKALSPEGQRKVMNVLDTLIDELR